MRIWSMLLIGALLAGCGCVDAGPDAASTCHGIGSVFKSDTPSGAAGDVVAKGNDELPLPRISLPWRRSEAAAALPRTPPGSGSSQSARPVPPRGAHAPLAARGPIALLTVGMTCSAISCIERRASRLSIQSWPA